MSDRTSPLRTASYDKKVGLVLQGGGALGSYQAGVYEALASSEYLPDWVAGISIGAINAAVIAGNVPEHRVQRLRSFWGEITAPAALWPFASAGSSDGMATSRECTDGADVRPARLFHAAFTAGLVFLWQMRQLLRDRRTEGNAGAVG